MYKRCYISLRVQRTLRARKPKGPGIEKIVIWLPVPGGYILGTLYPI